MEIPNFDEMTPKQVRIWGEELVFRAKQFGEIQATLIVNCKPGARLNSYGIAYNEDILLLRNLVAILEKLCDLADRQPGLPLQGDGE